MDCCRVAELLGYAQSFSGSIELPYCPLVLLSFSGHISIRFPVAAPMRALMPGFLGGPLLGALLLLDALGMARRLDAANAQAAPAEKCSSERQCAKIRQAHASAQRPAAMPAK